MTQRSKEIIVNFIEALGGIKKVPKKDKYPLFREMITIVNEFEKIGYDKLDYIFPHANSNRIEFDNKPNSVKIK